MDEAQGKGYVIAPIGLNRGDAAFFVLDRGRAVESGDRDFAVELRQAGGNLAMRPPAGAQNGHKGQDYQHRQNPQNASCHE